MLAALAALCGPNFSRGGKGSRPRGLPLRGPPGGNGVALPKHFEPVRPASAPTGGMREGPGLGGCPGAGCCWGKSRARPPAHVRGVPLLLLSSGESCLLLHSGLVKTPGPEHRVEHVASTAREGNERLVMAFALGDFPVVIGAGFGMTERSEGREEQGTFQDLVAPP